jgi:SNF family Na+-dependent transporter
LIVLASGITAILLLAVGWLLVLGMGLSSYHLVHIDGYLSSASSVEVLFMQLPIGMYHAVGGGAWGSAVALMALVWLGGLSLTAALLFLRSSSIQLQRDLNIPLHEMQTRLITVGLVCTLPFCTQGGVGLWLAMIDGLRYVVLPLLFFILWWALTIHLSFSGFIDYFRTASALPVTRWWGGYIRIVPAFFVLLHLCGSVLILVGMYRVPSLWNAPLIFLPLLGVFVYAWWYHKRGLQS